MQPGLAGRATSRREVESKRNARARQRTIARMERAARQQGAAATFVVDATTFARTAELAGPSYPGTSRAAAGRFRRAVTPRSSQRFSWASFVSSFSA